MANASTIALSTAQRTMFSVEKRSEESAAKASKLLQENHERNHTFFNYDEFHNHIAHHLCTVFALGASPEQIQFHYDNNVAYQRPATRKEPSVVSNMYLNEDFIFTYLGHERHYHSFLSYFEQEIAAKGYKAVLNQYLFSGSRLADDLLARMYAGYLHPIIHLGVGIEFEQPAIIAEALAQAAVHPDWMTAYLLGAEKAAKTRGNSSTTSFRLLADINKDPFLSTVTSLLDGDGLMDGNKLQYGICGRGAEAMIDVSSQFIVPADKLDEKTAEMISAAAWFTAAAQRPPKEVKFDFYSMHCVTASIFFPYINLQDWITTANKVRMLEWKVRSDLAIYASRRAPNLYLDEISEYRPRIPSSWENLFARVNSFGDEGHGAKLVRALSSGERVAKPFEQADAMLIKGDMWLKIAHMAVDSLEGTEGTGTMKSWVRGAGFAEAWEGFLDRSID